MRTKIAWPETCREIPGMMGFSAEWEDYNASYYKQRVVPLVTAAITTLENQIDVLKQQNEALKTALRANKPKFKYCHETDNWIVIKE